MERSRIKSQMGSVPDSKGLLDMPSLFFFTSLHFLPLLQPIFLHFLLLLFFLLFFVFLSSSPSPSFFPVSVSLSPLLFSPSLSPPRFLLFLSFLLRTGESGPQLGHHFRAGD